MSLKNQRTTWDLKETEAYVAREITEANMYKYLLSNLISPIAKDQELTKVSPATIHFTAVAYELACVSALAKVFAKDNEPGLDRLVQIAKAVPAEVAEVKLSEVVKDFFKDDFYRDRTIFLTNADTYRQEIAEIRDKLRPFRNAQRAHNFPQLVQKGSTTWGEFQKWLTFAERVYGQAMSAAGEGGLPVGGFLPATIESDVRYMVDTIKGAGFIQRVTQ